jgi:hypothetical protein
MVFAPYSFSFRIARMVCIQDATGCGMTFARPVRRLSESDTRQSFAFGSSFLEATDRPSETSEVAVSALEASENPNPSLLGGMISALFARDKNALAELLNHIMI